MQSECLIVTQCFYPDLGGIEGLMTALADNCTFAGRPVTVLADRVRKRPLDPEPGKPYDIIRFGGPRPWRRWRKQAYLKSILQKRGSQIAGIFADSWKSIESMPPSLQVPISVLAHGMEYPPDASPAKHRRIGAALARCSAVIANSSYTANLAARYAGADASKLQIIHPPIAPLPEPSAADLAGLRSRISSRGPVIATVARLEPRKGIDTVIRAMPELLLRHPLCIYAIAGAGDDRPRLEELALSLGVRDATIFLGRVSEGLKAALLASADVFAMPVRREGRSVEGFGISYLEAGWFGVPALAGRDGGAADAVLDGETGLVCDGSSQSEITRSLLLLLGNEPLRMRLGAAAQQRIKRDLSWPITIGRYLSSFKSSA
jgi:phosphatidylinositol alpha-1,6-mannosyltransferase